MEKDIRNHVLAAIIFISSLIIVTGIIIVLLARSLANNIKQPLAKLVDVVRALGRKDSPHAVCLSCFELSRFDWTAFIAFVHPGCTVPSVRTRSDNYF